MQDTTNQREFVIRYLLGVLPDAVQCQYEELYFTDDDLFAELLAVEQELLDCYGSGELTPAQRERLEAYFLRSVERQRRVHLAQQHPASKS